MKISKKKIQFNEKIRVTFVIGIMLLMTVLVGINAQNLNVEKLTSNQNQFLETKTTEYRYLSDLDFITDNNWSYNGWSGHEIQKDKNQDGGVLGLVVDGEIRSYSKGVSVHAKGQVTYDISALSTEYPRFVAKIGVDSSRGTNGSIWFQISVSNDGQTWTSLLKTNTMTGTTDAVDVDLNIEGYKYLRIYVDPAGSNAADHGTIANARLVKKDYVASDVSYDKIHNLDYYDEILSAHDADYNYENNFRLVLEREFVRKVGYWGIQDLATVNPSTKETLDWILSDDENLKQIIEVGEVNNGLTFFNTIHTLYSAYKEELKKENGYVYQKMLFGLAAAYGTDRVASPLTFSTRTQVYDVVERFGLMKQLFDEGQFMRTEEFKTYHVQLMRYVMQDAYRPEETIWLNALSHTKSNPFNHYAYMGYVKGPSYNRPEYQDPANKEMYDKKFMLSQYGVPYGDGVVRYWMAMQKGGICWNISRTGQSVYRVNGIPSVGVYQPQHEAYLAYSEDANGNGVWGAYYNVFGWGRSCTTWYGGNTYRMLFNWSAKYFADKAVTANSAGNSAGYMILGQAALNQKDPFFKSLYYNLIANSYQDNELKINTYNKALESSNLNLDSYDYIITLYKSMNKTSSEWHELAERIIDSYTYYPMAMYDLLKVIKPYLQGADRVDIDLREHEALVRASRATSTDVLQNGPMREIANVLLGKTKAELATFSFDGENAGKIIIDESYALHDFNLYYSLDGGATVSEKTTSHIIELTEEEIARINPDDDIRIMMDGTPQVYTINIEKATLPTTLFANDLENRVIGVNLTYEWRNSESDPWTSYKTASPNNTGDKTLQVRIGYTGKYVPSDAATFTFTEDNQPNTRKYVSVSHLSIHRVSSEATSNQGSSAFAIDGNYNTRWHSNWNGGDSERYIIIKLDKPRYVSAVEFVPAGGGNGKILDGTIYGSTDGVNWEKLSEQKNLTYTNQANTVADAIKNTKSFDITEPKEVEYIKIVADRASNGNWFTARAFNIYQDLTMNMRPTAGIGYSTTEPTRDNVVARLINVSATNYEILSEGGDTHVFTENGQEFTFRFRDKDTGLEGSATAKVDWIDREAPTATIEYSKTSPTNKSVIATLKPSEDVTVTNNGDYRITDDGKVTDKDGNVIPGYTADEDGNVKDEDGNIITNLNTFTYEFLDNGEFEFEFVDKAGNKGSALASVDWIDTTSPEGELSYDIKTLTNKNVTVTINFDEEAIVKNNNGKTSYTFTKNGEFTFEFEDLAGNRNQLTARVDWIDKTVPTAELTYERTDRNTVIVYVKNPSKDITFQTGNGVYEFDRNGNYDIIFYDSLGNMGKVTAKVTGLTSSKPDTSKPTPNPKPDSKPGNNNGNGNNNDNMQTNPSDKNEDDFNNNEQEKPLPNPDDKTDGEDKNDNKDDETDDKNDTNNKDENDDNTIEKEEKKSSNMIYIVLSVVGVIIVLAGIGFIKQKKQY